MKPLFKGIVRVTAFWPLLFVLGAVAVHLTLLPTANTQRNITDEQIAHFGYGGPVLEAQLEPIALSADLGDPQAKESDGNGTFAIVDGSAVAGGSNPLSNLIATRDGLKKYKVRKGDALSSIAAQFGITKETIRYANLWLGSSLSVGTELVILPVSGFLYEVQMDDTLDSVSARFQVNPDLITQYNPDYQRTLSAGHGSLILPYAKPMGKITLAVGTLPDLKDYFSLPARGWNWGELHEVNAVDIANKCGTPVYAAADGLVIDDDTLGAGNEGWNSGYGVFVLVEHSNGTKTRYAHLDKTLVHVGDLVSQGEEIGLMGNTGNTQGLTGCHVHFEVYGAKNPFALR